MTDIVLLREIIENKKCSVAYISRQIGKTPQAIHNKLNGKSEFTVSEVKVLCDVLQLTTDQRDKIFYSRG